MLRICGLDASFDAQLTKMRTLLICPFVRPILPRLSALFSKFVRPNYSSPNAGLGEADNRRRERITTYRRSPLVELDSANCK